MAVRGFGQFSSFGAVLRPRSAGRPSAAFGRPEPPAIGLLPAQLLSAQLRSKRSRGGLWGGGNFFSQTSFGAASSGAASFGELLSAELRSAQLRSQRSRGGLWGGGPTGWVHLCLGPTSKVVTSFGGASSGAASFEAQPWGALGGRQLRSKRSPGGLWGGVLCAPFHVHLANFFLVDSFSQTLFGGLRRFKFHDFSARLLWIDLAGWVRSDDRCLGKGIP